jgi:UDP-2,3-diacylglucosamine hydrolase
VTDPDPGSGPDEAAGAGPRPCSGPGADGTVALVAGAGRLPLLALDALDRAGRPARVLALRGFADPALRRRADAVIDILDVRGALAQLAAWAPACVALAGAVARPSPAAILGAASALRSRRELQAIAAQGDDGLLRGVVALLEDHGHRVVGVDALAPDLLAPEGCLTAVAPEPAARAAVEAGRALLAALAPFDVGQAAVMAGSRALAVEGPEGTDRMLARAGGLAKPGLLPWSRPRPGSVLVKLAKAGQDRRIDLPAVGPQTVRRAAAAGCCGLALGAGGTLILDRAETVAQADRLGLFVLGVAP